MLNGKTAQQKILAILATIPEPIKVETISRQLNLSEHTARKSLTDLKKANLVVEFSGNWIATPEGKELHSTNPYFGAFSVNPPTERRENWAELLGSEVINSGFGRGLLQEPPVELLEKLKPYLSFFVLAWLVAERIHVDFNSFDEVVQNANSRPVVDALNFLIQEIES